MAVFPNDYDFCLDASREVVGRIPLDYCPLTTRHLAAYRRHHFAVCLDKPCVVEFFVGCVFDFSKNPLTGDISIFGPRKNRRGKNEGQSSNEKNGCCYLEKTLLGHIPPP